MPLAGAVADRFDRILIARYVRFFALVMGGILAALSMSGSLTMPLLIFLMMLTSAADGIWMPLRWAMVPSLVERDQLTSAISIGSVLFNFSQFAGPALAGLIIVAWGVSAAFLVSALILAPLLVVLILLPRENRAVDNTLNVKQLMHDVVEAGRYTLSHRAFALILATAFAASFCIRSLREFFAGFADDVFMMGAQGLAALNSALGLGAFTTALGLMLYGRRRGLARFVLFCLALLVLSQILFVGSGSYYVALACALVLGFCFTGTNTGFQILMQNNLDDNRRGRVMSLWATQVRCAPALGAYAFGMLDLIWPISQVLLVAGLAFALCWLYLVQNYKALHALEQ
jgi:MFS family permease